MRLVAEIFRRLVPVAPFAMLAATAPSPAAAATWSAPVNVSSPATFIDRSFIGFGRSGVGLAAWSWQNGVDAGAGATGGTRVSSLALSGAFGPERAAPTALGAPLVYRFDRVLLVGEEAAVTRPRERDRIKVAFGRTDGSFRRPKTIDTVETFGIPAAAANVVGQVAVAYIRLIRGRHRATKLAVRRGVRFGRPRVVSPNGGVNSITVAIGLRGDLVVAWERGGRIEARIRRPGHGLGRVLRVGRGAKGGTQLRAAVAPGGRVWIAWSSQMRSEGGDRGPFTLRTAVTKGSGFSRPVLIDRYTRSASDEATFKIELGRGGTGAIAWSTFDGQNFRARLGLADRTGRFHRFQTLSQPGYDAVVGDLATSRLAGEVLVVWSRLDAVGEVGTSVLAGYLPPSGPYSGEEQVSQGDRARQPAVDFNPSTGRATAVWSQREGPDGPGVPLEQIRTFVRASTRVP